MKMDRSEFQFRYSWLPNTVTMLNLFSGFFAILMITEAKYVVAGWFIFAAMIFDSLDGNIARALKNPNIFGRELDSLSDIVSFVVAPALLVFRVWSGDTFSIVTLIAALTYLWAGTYRLARFNVRPPVRAYFEGCPTPAGGVTVVMSVIAYQRNEWPPIFHFVIQHGFLLFLISYLMVSRIPYPKLSGVKFSKWQFFFYIGALIFGYTSFVTSLETAIALLFMLYLFISPIFFHYLPKPLEPKESYQVV